MINVEEIRKQEFKAGSNPGPTSFCTIIDSNALGEGLFCLHTIRTFHDQPIYVICDMADEDNSKISGRENVQHRLTIHADSNDDIKRDLTGGYNS